MSGIRWSSRAGWCMLILVAGLVGMFCPVLVAQNDPAAPEPFAAPAVSGGRLSANVRYIPFTDLEETWQANPRGMLIPRAEFERLKRDKEAFLARTPASPQPRLDADFVQGRSTFTGTISEKVGRFEAEFVFEMPNDRWALFPLPGGDIGLEQVTLDGRPVGVTVNRFSGIQDPEAPKGNVEILQQKRKAPAAAVRRSALVSGRRGASNDFLLAVRGVGRHTVKVVLVCPQVDDPERNELTFRIPRMPMNTFAVTLDTPGQFGEVDRSEGTRCRDDDGHTVVEGVLGPTDRFTVRWAPRSGAGVIEPPADRQPEETAPDSATGTPPEPDAVPAAPPEPPRVYADSATLLSVGEGFIRSEAQIRLRIARSGIDGISLLLPSGTELLDLQSPNLESHRIEALATATRVVCVFSAQVRQSCELSMVCDTKMAETSQAVGLPVHRLEGVERDAGFIGVEARTSIEIRKGAETSSDLQVSGVDVTDLPPDLTRRAIRPILLSYRYFTPPFDPAVTVQVIRHSEVDTLTAAIDHLRATTFLGLNRQALTSLDLEVKNNGRQYLETWLASGAEILSAELNGAPVKPSSRGDSSYLIPLGGGSARRSAASSFRVRLTYRAPIPEFGWKRNLQVPLPKLDVRTSRLEWTVYAPEWNALLLLPSGVERVYQKAVFHPFAVLAELCEALAHPFLLLLILILWLAKRLWNWVTQPAPGQDQPGFAWGRALGSLAVVGVLVVLIASMTTSMGTHRAARMFETVGTSLPTPSVYAPPQEQEIAMDEEALSDGIRQDVRRESSVMSLKSKADDMNMPAAQSLSPSGGAAAPSSSAPPPPKQRMKAGRDRGALPVDPIIPRTGNSIFVTRNDIAALETPSLRVFVLWEPVRFALTLALALAGFFVFLVVRALARRGRGFLTWLVALGYSAALLALEERFPGLQDPGLLAIAACFGVVVLWRVWAYLRVLGGGKTVVAVLLLLAVPAAGTAATGLPPGEKDPRVEQTIDVFIPYSQLGERLATDSPLVFLKYEDYRYLHDLGLPEPDPTLWLPPVGVTYVSCSLTGMVHDDVVILRLRMEADLLGKGFKSIPFPTSQVGIQSLTLDGSPAVLAPLPPFAGAPAGPWAQGAAQQQRQVDIAQTAQMNMAPQALNDPANTWNDAAPGHAIITDREGRVVIEADLVKDLLGRGQAVRAKEGFTLGLPPFGAGKLDLVLDRPRQFVEIEPAAQVTTLDQATGTRVAAVLQPASLLRVEWRDRVKAPSVPAVPETVVATQPPVVQEAKVFIDHAVLFGITEGVITIRDLVTLTIEQNSVGEFAFLVPPGAEVMDVAGPDVASWSAVSAGAKGQELKVALHARRRDQVSLAIEMERATPAINGEFPLDIPWMQSAGAHARLERQKGYFGVEVGEGIEARILDQQPATMVDPGELPGAVRDQAQGFLAFAFKFLARVTPRIGLTKHQEVTVSTAQIDGAIARSLVSRDGKVLTQLELVVRNNNNQFLILDKLPPTTRVLSVVLNGEPVKPGLGEAGEVFIPLIRSPQVNKVLQPFGVVIYFESRVPLMARRGKVELFLPAMSLDASELTWIVSMPDGTTIQEASPDFQLGAGGITSLPGLVRGEGQSRQMLSNAMTQSVMKKTAAEAGAGERSMGGVLPVVPTIPATGNQIVVNKKLVSTSGPTHLRLLYVREWVFSEILLLLSFVVAGFLAWALTDVWRNSWKGLSAGFLMTVLLGVTVFLLEEFFGAFSGIPAQARQAYISGLQAGALFFLLWILLIPEPPATASSPSSSGTTSGSPAVPSKPV
ncbi:MAG: hypothetical protein GX442_03290 [Candidatus Riflebacteria bacterium]|nr:hypothetical protein [Candidatus Riflebacteria bacterium]